MAERRMFAKTIIDSDAFMDMPMSARCLYYDLAMRADDDGFINNPKKIQRMIGASEDDLRLLIVKRFIIPFDSGIVVIKHWRIHNYIRNDRYKPTVYEDEISQLDIKDNNSYTLKNDVGIPIGYQMETQDRLGKVSIGKDSKDIAPPLLGEFKNVRLSDEEKTKIEEQNLNNYINVLSVYLEQTGKKYKSHYATILSWSRRDANEKPNKKNRTEVDVVYPTVTSTKISPEEEAQLKQAFEMLES